jgi:hypothetical protein
MNLEEISKNFVYALIVYLFVLAYGLNFIFSNLSYGGLTSDFWLIALVILLPLILSVIFALRSRIEFLYGRAKLLQRLIILFIIIATVFVVVVIVPISY